MKKVLIVGISGTGKTRFANLLSDKLSLPVVHLDSIFWKENWVEEDEDIVKRKIKREISKDSWIIEGYIEPLSRERMLAADKVIYLDYSGLAALRGGLVRSMKHRKEPRPEMPAGNTDGMGYKFFRSLIKREEWPEIEATVKGFQGKTIRLKNRREANRYLTDLDPGLHSK